MNEKNSLFGLVAVFDDQDLLLEAAGRVKEEGYEKINAYTPYPVHGLPEVMGYKAEYLRWLAYIALIVGALAGFLLQYLTATTGYDLIIAGRPFNSWPAFVPISFEVAILVTSLTVVAGMLIGNGLPQPYHPIFNTPGFELASGETFYLCIQTTDQRFHRQETRAFLESLGPVSVSEVPS